MNMCGIAGIVYKAEAGACGRALLNMLCGCQHRGPDSTGLAVYGEATDGLVFRLFLDADLSHDSGNWPARLQRVQDVLCDHTIDIRDTWHDNEFAMITCDQQSGIPGATDIQTISYAIEETPGVEIFSAGYSLHVIKDVGTADDLDRKFDCAPFIGTHGIGHVRLATESDVNPSTSHPFWAYGFNDVAIVHNGQITNYFKLKRLLQQRGYRFRTENDSELIAVYLADKMTHGQSMDDALAQSLDELDGTFSFLVATPEGVGYAKDRIGAKPMVVCETDEFVAVASEEVSLQQILGHQTIPCFEPYPGTTRTWSRSMQASLTSAR